MNDNILYFDFQIENKYVIGCYCRSHLQTIYSNYFK